MDSGLVLLAWVVGATFGALWLSALERGDDKSAQLYGGSMLYCYFVAVIVETVSSLVGGPLGYGWLLYLLGALLLSVIIGFNRKRNRQ
jgi:hypothetical protein